MITADITQPRLLAATSLKRFANILTVPGEIGENKGYLICADPH